MKNKKLLINLIFLLAFILVTIIMVNAWEDPYGGNFSIDCKGDHCGRVVGWIYDDVTKKQVKTEFILIFWDIHKTDMSETLNGNPKNVASIVYNGKFSLNVPEGDYYLQFAPREMDNNYSFDPIPLLNPENAQEIHVRRQQVTIVKKYIKPGGKLRIILVDKNNNKIQPAQIFNEFKILTYLSSDRVSPHFIAGFWTEDDLNDGELFNQSLFPETYRLFIEFEGLGYGTQWIDNVKIERNQITEVRVLFNLSDNTGIEGRVVDQNGNPLKNVHVSAYSHEEFKFVTNGADIYSDENGYYKIIGLKENKYDLKIYIKINGKSIKKNIDNIGIHQNILLKKIITININD